MRRFFFGLALILGIAFLWGQEKRFVLPTSALAPVAKRSGSGSIGIVWERHEGGWSEIHFGRIPEDGTLSSSAVVSSSQPLFSPDLDFDGADAPWITWIEEDGRDFRVRVADLALSRTWTVNGPYTASALNPEILASGRGEVWVFWTGRDRGRDEIFGCVRRGEIWSGPFRLNKDDRYPHLSQSAALDAGGNPRVVWSAYDGRDYEIFSSAWNGARWSPEERITDDIGADTSPVIAFVGGTIPLIAWSRSFGGASFLFARYKERADWSAEIEIVADRRNPIRFPKIAVLGDRIGLTWETGGNVESLLTGFIDLAGGTKAVSSSLVMAAPAAAARDENQYTTFGDSITYADNDGYQIRLKPLLVQKYGSAILWNEGRDGETTMGGLTRIDQVIAARAAKYLLLMEGTNDVIFLQISMDTAAFDLEEMAMKSQRAGMIPLISTIIPRSDWHGTIPFYQGRIIDLNDKIRRFAEARRFRLVDQYDVFMSYPDSLGGWTALTDDGVHPNLIGYEVMAKAWFSGIVVQKSPHPPPSLSLSTQLDGTGTRKINALSWQANPENAAVPLRYYRVYRKQAGQEDMFYAFLASVSSGTLQHEDAGLDVKTKYAYRLTALSQWNDESGPSPSVAETKKFEFVPLSPVLRTTLVRLRTTKDKTNTVFFENNPLNEDSDVSGYRVYRRKAEEGDERLAPVSLLGVSSLRYRDLHLPEKQKYAYAIMTIFKDGRESRFSVVVSEK